MTASERLALALASRLLEYPDDEFFRDLPDLRKELSAEADSENSARAFAAMRSFLDCLEQRGPDESRRDYVETFDMDPSGSLYMSWHRYGNDRSQGKAMAALNGLYRAAGFEPLGDCLPDYLPVMLEFLSVCEAWAQEALLDGFGAEIARLEKNLLDANRTQARTLSAALSPLKLNHPGLFRERPGPDPTKRPMARPDEELSPLMPLRRGENGADCATPQSSNPARE